MTVELDDLKTMWLQLKTHVDLLAAERQQYLDFFEQSPEAYVVTDALGAIADLNGAGLAPNAVVPAKAGTPFAF